MNLQGRGVGTKAQADPETAQLCVTFSFPNEAVPITKLCKKV